jgi:hypothetical protein
MKKSMNSMLIAAAAGLFFTSCQQTEVLPDASGVTVIAVNELPQNAISFIANNYDLSQVSSASLHRRSGSDDIFEADLSWGMDLYFDDHGGLRGSRDDDNGSDDYLSVSDLPAAIVSYIQAHYSATITEVERNHHANGSFSFEIELSNGTELYFDATGNFLLEDDRGGRSNGQSSPISTADLPVALTNYIQAQYPGATIVKAEKKRNDDGSFRKYEIELSNGTELYFDESGQLLSDDSSSHSGSGSDDSVNIAVSDLPRISRDYLAAHYAGKSIERAKKRLNDNGSVRGYEARLSDNTKVFFDGAGNFIGDDD